MKRARFTEEQILFALRQAESGTKVPEICRRRKISEPTFYRWREHFAGLGTPELRELRQLRKENGKLKRLVADLSLDREMMRDALVREALRPDQQRVLVAHSRTAFQASERRVCRLFRIHRSTERRVSQAADQGWLKKRIQEIAQMHPSWGYRRIRVRLRREGLQVNAKRVCRLYREGGLVMKRRRKRRHRSSEIRQARSVPMRPDEAWSMGFMADETFDGRRLRILTVVDDCTRECLAAEAGQRMGGRFVMTVLEQFALRRGARPDRIRVDNGSEFTGKVLDHWVYGVAVRLDFSRPWKPTDNGIIEVFNGRVRDECLNANWFLSLPDAREKLYEWRRHYDAERPHRALGDLVPEEYAARCRQEVEARST